MSTTKKLYLEKVKQELQKEFNYGNVHQIPKVTKVIIHRRLGESVSNSKVVQATAEQFFQLFGAKPLLTRSKKSISNFKLREGQIIGAKLTLRGDKMYEFLTKLFHVVLPKIRDFRGLPRKSFDGRGSYSLGLKEDLIFPETDFDKIDTPRGFDLTFVTSAKTDAEALFLLEKLGLPLVKIDQDENKG